MKFAPEGSRQSWMKKHQDLQAATSLPWPQYSAIDRTKQIQPLHMNIALQRNQLKSDLSLFDHLSLFRHREI